MATSQPTAHGPAPRPSISWSLEHEEIESGTKQEIHCLIEIDGGPEPERTRMPYDLALVVDRSGSMTGPGIAIAKGLVESLLAKLGPEDRVALVAYADAAEILVPIAGSREEVLTAVQGLEATGESDVASGLALGVEALLDARDPGREKRVLLITDAEQQPRAEAAGSLAEAMEEARARHGITTVAIGLTSWVASMMVRGLRRLGVAETALVEQLDQAPAAFARVLPGVWELAAERVVMDIAAAQGMGVRGIHRGRAFEESDEVQLGRLCRGERRRIVRSFRVPPDGSLGVRVLGHIVVRYVPPGLEEEASVATTVRVTARPAPFTPVAPDPTWGETVGAIIEEDAIEAASRRSGKVAQEILEVAVAEVGALGAPGHAQALQALVDVVAARRRLQSEVLAACESSVDGKVWIEAEGIGRAGWISVEALPASIAKPSGERRRRLLMVSVARQAASIEAASARRAALRIDGADGSVLDPGDDLDFHGAERRGEPEREATALPHAVVAWWEAHRGPVSVRCNLHGEIARFDATRSIDMLGPAWDVAVIENHDRWERAWKGSRDDGDFEGCEVRIEPTADPGGANLLDVEQMWHVFFGAWRPWWSYRRVGESGHA